MNLRKNVSLKSYNTFGLDIYAKRFIAINSDKDVFSFLELIRKISKMDLLSDEVSGNLFENVYSDETRLFEPRAVFNDRTLLTHITKRFPAGFRDHKLEDKVIHFWADKNLPKINISLDNNTVKLSAESLSKIKISSSFISKIDQLQEKSLKIRKKKLY